MTSVTAPPRDPELRLAEMMRDVRDVIRHLEGAGVDELQGAVARCNASIESCLETERERRDRDVSLGTAKDELKRLASLLTKVDLADVVMVMRQIRVVLGRFDSSL